MGYRIATRTEYRILSMARPSGAAVLQYELEKARREYFEKARRGPDLASAKRERSGDTRRKNLKKRGMNRRPFLVLMSICVWCHLATAGDVVSDAETASAAARCKCAGAALAAVGDAQAEHSYHAACRRGVKRATWGELAAGGPRPKRTQGAYGGGEGGSI